MCERWMAQHSKYLSPEMPLDGKKPPGWRRLRPRSGAENHPRASIDGHSGHRGETCLQLTMHSGAARLAWSLTHTLPEWTLAGYQDIRISGT